MRQNLTPEQVRFATMVMEYPRLSGYWDFDRQVCHEDALRARLNVMSSDERQLALFFLSLWSGNDEGFDMLDAASALDVKQRQLFINWLRDPFWS